jgi:hypothetical protein
MNYDNKLKRHPNISYYGGVYNPRFNQNYFVFYFVSVIIKNIFLVHYTKITIVNGDWNWNRIFSKTPSQSLILS